MKGKGNEERQFNDDHKFAKAKNVPNSMKTDIKVEGNSTPTRKLGRFRMENTSDLRK